MKTIWSHQREHWKQYESVFCPWQAQCIFPSMIQDFHRIIYFNYTWFQEVSVYYNVMILFGNTCMDGIESQSCAVTSRVSRAACRSMTLLWYTVHRYAHHHTCRVFTLLYLRSKSYSRKQSYHHFPHLYDNRDGVLWKCCCWGSVAMRRQAPFFWWCHLNRVHQDEPSPLKPWRKHLH